MRELSFPFYAISTFHLRCLQQTPSAVGIPLFIKVTPVQSRIVSRIAATTRSRDWSAVNMACRNDVGMHYDFSPFSNNLIDSRKMKFLLSAFVDTNLQILGILEYFSRKNLGVFGNYYSMSYEICNFVAVLRNRACEIELEL